MTGRPVAVVVTPSGRHAVIVPPPSPPAPEDAWTAALCREREAAQRWRLMFPVEHPPGGG